MICGWSKDMVIKDVLEVMEKSQKKKTRAIMLEEADAEEGKSKNTKIL